MNFAGLAATAMLTISLCTAGCGAAGDTVAEEEETAERDDALAEKVVKALVSKGYSKLMAQVTAICLGAQSNFDCQECCDTAFQTGLLTHSDLNACYVECSLNTPP
jgi:hypothetical protein